MLAKAGVIIMTHACSQLQLVGNIKLILQEEGSVHHLLAIKGNNFIMAELKACSQ